jgi:hypothetical protein
MAGTGSFLCLSGDEPADIGARVGAVLSIGG